MSHGNAGHILAFSSPPTSARPPVLDLDADLDEMPDAPVLDPESPSMQSIRQYAGVCEHAPHGEPGVFGLGRGRQHPDPQPKQDDFEDALGLDWAAISC